MPWLRNTCRSMVWMRLEMVTTSMPPMRSTAVGPIVVSTPAFIGPSFLKTPSDSIFTMAFALHRLAHRLVGVAAQLDVDLGADAGLRSPAAPSPGS